MFRGYANSKPTPNLPPRSVPPLVTFQQMAEPDDATLDNGIPLTSRQMFWMTFAVVLSCALALVPLWHLGRWVLSLTL
jgi:hypothetical protein